MQFLLRRGFLFGTFPGKRFPGSVKLHFQTCICFINIIETHEFILGLECLPRGIMLDAIGFIICFIGGFHICRKHETILAYTGFRTTRNYALYAWISRGDYEILQNLWRCAPERLVHHTVDLQMYRCRHKWHCSAHLNCIGLPNPAHFT